MSAAVVRPWTTSRGTTTPSPLSRSRRPGRDATQPTAVAVPATGGPVNDLLPFLDFVEHHPLGSAVTGIVESYSSHGAYVKIGDVRGYVPLRLMGSPPPAERP